jgi:hypothetical protein
VHLKHTRDNRRLVAIDPHLSGTELFRKARRLLGKVAPDARGILGDDHVEFAPAQLRRASADIQAAP